MLAAGPADLGLVDVMQQRGRLDQRAVDRDRGLGHQPGGRHGDAGHALGMDDDAVGQPGVGQQLTGGISVGDGHGPILPVAARPCTIDGRGPAGIGSDAECHAIGDDLDVAVRSVRKTAISGRAASVARVSGAG